MSDEIGCAFDVEQAVFGYRGALESIKYDIDAKNWLHLEDSRNLLEKATEALRLGLQDYVMDTVLQEKLTQLSLQHRRIMRQLNEQMQRTQEDLESLNQGLKQVQKFPALAA